MVWGVVGVELAGFTAVVLRVGVWPDMGDTEEGLVLSSPLLVGAGSGVAGWAWCLPPRVALALHGGLYTALATGLATALVRGALSLGGTLRFDALAGAGALVGAIPGILVGGLEVDPDDPLEVWLGAPPGGMLAGVVAAAVVAIAAFLSGNDPGAGGGDQLIGWPIFAGLATGLVVATGSVVD